MAYHSTHFSCLLDLGTSDNAAEALLIYAALSEHLAREEDAIGFLASIHDEPDATKLWIRDADHGDPEHVITFVKRCAGAFKLSGLWGFQWADTCTKAELDAFGGAAHVIDLASGETAGWCDTRTWLDLVLDGGDPDA